MFFSQLVSDIEKARSEYDTDMSVRAAITEEGLDDEYENPLVLFYTGRDVEANYAAPVSDLSMKLLNDYGVFDGKEEVFPGGYIQIIEAWVDHSDKWKTFGFLLLEPAAVEVASSRIRNAFV